MSDVRAALRALRKSPAFTLVAVVISALLVGLVPALQASKARLVDVLKTARAGRPANAPAASAQC
jgi:hypothetical protein